MPTNIDCSAMFSLSDPLADRPLRFAPVEDWIDKAAAIALFYGQLQPLRPVILHTSMGGIPYDFVWSVLMPMVCVSRRVVDLFQSAGIIGWGLYPVKLYGRQGQLVRDYYGFSVISYAGEDIRRSQIVIKDWGGKPVRFYKGVYFHESEWDGSDIFRIQHARIAVTLKVRNILKNNKVTNIKLEPLADVERHFAVIEVGKIYERISPESGSS
jgi:hypothetical protein